MHTEKNVPPPPLSGVAPDAASAILPMSVPDVVENAQKKNELSKNSFFGALSFGIFLALIFLLPVFFVPLQSVSFLLSKNILFVIATTLSFGFWSFSRLKNGTLSIPRTYLLPTLLLVLLVFLVSSFFSKSPAVSLIGEGSELGTFVSMAFLMLFSFLTATIANSRPRIFKIYCALFAAFLLLSLFQLSRLVLGPEFLSFGLFKTSIGNLLGKWNDFGIFYGLVSVMILTALQMITLRVLVRGILYVALAISVFFLALVNFITIWFVLIFFSVVLGVSAFFSRRASLHKNTLGSETETKKAPLQKISIGPIAVCCISIVFIVVHTPLFDFFSKTFNLMYLEARPSWQSTLRIVKHSLGDRLLFGTGPNRFNTEWQLDRPDGINETPFWSVSFNSGIGHIPTFFATTGVAGIVVWILFFVILLASGFRSFLVSREDRLTHFLVVLSFFSALYCWVFMVFYIPSVSLVAYTFLFTGLYVATLVQEKLMTQRTILFSANPKMGFVISLSCMLALVGYGGGAYVLSRFALASSFFQQAIITLQNSNDLPLAKASLKKAISVHGFDAYYRLLASLNLSELNVLLGRSDLKPEALQPEFQRLFTEAKQNATAAKDYDETQSENWVSLGGIYGAIVPLGIDEKVYSIAVEHYRHALMLSPKDPSLYLALGRLDALRRDFSSARTNISEALKRKNNYTEAIFFLSQVEASAGNLSAATEAAEAAASIAPDDPVVFFHLGLLKYNNNDNEGAMRALERAVSIDDAYSNARYFLGLAYERLDKNAEAIVQFEKIEKFNPDNKEVQNILGNLRAGRKAFATDTNTSSPDPLKHPTLPIDETPTGKTPPASADTNPTLP